MSALLETFQDDGCIKGLFGRDSDTDSSDSDEEREQSECTAISNSEKDDSVREMTEFTSELPGEGERKIVLETNKLRGIAHQVLFLCVFFLPSIHPHFALFLLDVARFRTVLSIHGAAPHLSGAPSPSHHRYRARCVSFLHARIFFLNALPLPLCLQARVWGSVVCS